MESVAVSFAKIIGHTAAGRQLLLPIALSVPEPLRSQNRRIYRPVMISNYERQPELSLRVSVSRKMIMVLLICLGS